MEFLVFRKRANEKRKAKMRKTIYTGKLPTSKSRTRKSFWVFFFSATTIQTRKKNKKEARNIFLDFLKVFQTHKKKARK